VNHTHPLPPPLLHHWNWQAQAECRGMDPAIFFPSREAPPTGRPAPTGPAKAVCQRCPVVAACLDHALQAREPYGVRGGRSEAERAELLGLESLRYPAMRSRPPRRSAAGRREAWRASKVTRRVEDGAPVQA
jgi:WhiB family redox-sensing transcriptional regulator